MTGLTDKIAQAIDDYCRTHSGVEPRDVAEAVVSVVTAHTTVETIEELDALPVGAIVIDWDGDIICRDKHGWYIWNDPDPIAPIDNLDRYVPATRVLFRPDGGES